METTFLKCHFYLCTLLTVRVNITVTLKVTYLIILFNENYSSYKLKYVSWVHATQVWHKSATGGEHRESLAATCCIIVDPIFL